MQLPLGCPAISLRMDRGATNHVAAFQVVAITKTFSTLSFIAVKIELRVVLLPVPPLPRRSMRICSGVAFGLRTRRAIRNANFCFVFSCSNATLFKLVGQPELEDERLEDRQ
jgi:hypothetical protein